MRGSVRLVAAAATRLRQVGVTDLIPSDVAAWQSLRASLIRRANPAYEAHPEQAFRRDSS